MLVVCSGFMLVKFFAEGLIAGWFNVKTTGFSKQTTVIN